ncbi:hypothetical protein BDZ90DRAFT_261292 [Jaminaea rosea]|uniref:CCHC-type domain-containing protein n=1 Tax=Jaminaea rosea TaxID=1569628 RepID=A0A316UMM0_9BASI|nr:hypothetical protein BDZ90DRAFT_261292 [Jaminaea rosea]PWN26480.1 hypothetical protein BDZ90DRAFT_261292 [Jaminaea rosea]
MSRSGDSRDGPAHFSPFQEPLSSERQQPATPEAAGPAARPIRPHHQPAFSTLTSSAGAPRPPARRISVPVRPANASIVANRTNPFSRKPPPNLDQPFVPPPTRSYAVPLQPVRPPTLPFRPPVLKTSSSRPRQPFIPPTLKPSSLQNSSSSTLNLITPISGPPSFESESGPSRSFVSCKLRPPHNPPESASSASDEGPASYSSTSTQDSFCPIPSTAASTSRNIPSKSPATTRKSSPAKHSSTSAKSSKSPSTAPKSSPAKPSSTSAESAARKPRCFGKAPPPPAPVRTKPPVVTSNTFFTATVSAAVDPSMGGPSRGVGVTMQATPQARAEPVVVKVALKDSLPVNAGPFVEELVDPRRVYPGSDRPVIIGYEDLPRPDEGPGRIAPLTIRYRIGVPFKDTPAEREELQSTVRAQMRQHLGTWAEGQDPVTHLPLRQRGQLKAVDVTFASVEQFVAAKTAELQYRGRDLSPLFCGLALDPRRQCIVVTQLPRDVGISELLRGCAEALNPWGQVMEAWTPYGILPGVPPTFLRKLVLLFERGAAVRPRDLPGYVRLDGESFELIFHGRLAWCGFCRGEAASFHLYENCPRRRCNRCHERGHLEKACPLSQADRKRMRAADGVGDAP